METFTKALLKSADAKLIIDELKQDLSVKVLTQPIITLLNEKASQDIEKELFSLWLLTQIKIKDNKNTPKIEDLDFKDVKSKLSRAVNKSVITQMHQAAELLLTQELSAKERDFLASLYVQVSALNSTGAKTSADVSSNTKGYQNPYLKEILTQFESNQSVVYLMQLVERVYAPDYTIGRLSRGIAALEVLWTCKKGEAQIDALAKENVSLKKALLTIRNSIATPLLELCTKAIDAMIHRQEEVIEVTPALRGEIKRLESEFSKLLKEAKES